MPQEIWNESPFAYQGFSRNGTVDSAELAPFGKEVDDAIKLHAEEAYPLEACGVVIDGKYIRCENVHPAPSMNFAISEEFVKANRNRIQAIAHSHPQFQPFPSQMDMEYQQAWDIPWAIATLNTITDKNNPRCIDMFWYGDVLGRLPLLGRVFRPGVQDCFALARDKYFLDYGLDIPNVPRRDQWWENDEGEEVENNFFLDYFDEAGFKIIDVGDLRPGDAFACPVGTTAICHCGVFLKPEEGLLHHKANQPSMIEPNTHKWIKRTLAGGRFYRHKELNQ